jgi:hypothetical protein
MPKAADCIPLFIGSLAEREAYGVRTYFFTEGYLNSGGNIISEADHIHNRYGEKTALRILKKMLGHYEDFAVVDTGVFDVEALRSRLDDFAKPLEIPVKLIPGSLKLIDALLAGDWQDEEFLILEPGGRIRFEDSLEAGKSQSATSLS